MSKTTRQKVHFTPLKSDIQTVACIMNTGNEINFVKPEHLINK
jgi:hypothetical protein